MSLEVGAKSGSRLGKDQSLQLRLPGGASYPSVPKTKTFNCKKALIRESCNHLPSFPRREKKHLHYKVNTENWKEEKSCFRNHKVKRIYVYSHIIDQ